MRCTWLCHPGSAGCGRGEIGVYVSRARTTHTQRASERGRTHRYTLYILVYQLGGRSHAARHAYAGGPRRWRCVRGGVDGRTPSRFPSPFSRGPHVWCVYTPCPARPGRLLGGRRFNTRRVQTCRERSTEDRSRETCAGRPIDRSIDQWGSYRASR